MRSDELYLRDMLFTINDITAFLEGYDRDRFLEDRVMRRAILQALTEIGEAANHVSTELKNRYPDVPWDDARAFRNFVIHQYFAIVWALSEIPPLSTFLSFARRSKESFPPSLSKSNPLHEEEQSSTVKCLRSRVLLRYGQISQLNTILIA